MISKGEKHVCITGKY